MTKPILAGLVLGLVVSGAALAQSYTAPAGIPAATAPGGIEGRAAARNRDAYAGHPSHVGPAHRIVDEAGTTGSLTSPARPRGR